jgi:hypothetical protein
MSQSNRGIVGQSSRAAPEGAHGWLLPFFSLILRGSPHNMSCLGGFSGLAFSAQG